MLGRQKSRVLETSFAILEILAFTLFQNARAEGGQNHQETSQLLDSTGQQAGWVKIWPECQKCFLAWKRMQPFRTKFYKILNISNVMHFMNLWQEFNFLSCDILWMIVSWWWMEGGETVASEIVLFYGKNEYFKASLERYFSPKKICRLVQLWLFLWIGP